MQKRLSRAYPSRFGAPVVETVDARIFTLTYYQDCMACTFCRDWCCSWGADIDIANAARLEAEGAALVAFTGVAADDWLLPEPPLPDAESPGGAYTRTAARDGACVFLDRKGRGCRIHAYALEMRREPRDLKPMVCTLFPVVIGQGLMRPASELIEGALVCAGPGGTAYAAARDGIGHYFGPELVRELDALESRMARRT